MASTLRFDNWENSNGDLIGTAANGYLGVPGTVLQVVSTTKGDAFTTTSTSFVDVPNLSVSITPSSTSSKILLLAFIDARGLTNTNAALTRLMRDSTAIAISDVSGSKERSSSMMEIGYATNLFTPIGFLDTPATVSPLSYKWQVRNNVSGQTVYVNRTITDSDNLVYGRAVSSITALEIAG